MVIRSLLRPSSLVLSFALFARMAAGAEDEGVTKSVQYKRADANLYARGDVLKADPAAAIMPSTAFAQNGDTYTYTPEKKAPRTVYLESPTDWVEPVTPPDAPASLAIAPDAMEIREMQGDVQVAMPNAPTSFSPASNGMGLPNGAVVKTGPGATAAILFGGVDSARLMPNSEAAVQQAVASTSRAAEVDLTAGGVFSKVGTQVGVGNDFQVHTPFGTALTSAGDFVAYSMGDRTDVWVEQGTVDLLAPDGKKFGSATGVGSGPLKLIRFPAITDSARAQKADAESLTAILNFLPMANQKLAVLHAKAAQNVTLTPNEQAYLARIKQVPALIKLALVVPPPSELTVLADGTVGFQGQTLSLVDLNARLKDFVATNYDPSVVLMAGTGATYANFQAAKKALQDAAVAHVTTEGPIPAAPPPPPAPQDVVVTANGMVKLNGAILEMDDFTTRLKALLATAPDVAVTVHADSKASFREITAVINTCKSAPVKNLTIDLPPLKELTVSAHADGTIGFHGAKLKLDEFGNELQAAVALYPDLPIVLHSNPSMDYAKFKAVSDACNAAGAKQVTVVQPAPKPPATVPVPAPAPVVAATPPAPAAGLALTPPEPLAPPKPPKPAQVIAHADGTIKFQGKTMKIDEFTAAIKDAAAASPDLAVILHSNPKMDYAKFQAVLDACNNAPIKNVTVVQPAPKPAPAPAIVEAPPTPAPVPAPEMAVTPPAPAPVPVNTAPVPGEIDLAVDGSLTLDGAAVSEDELKDKLGDIKKTNPKNPLVMMKQHGVTKAQWMHYVDLCHSIGLKLLVKNAKATAVATTPPVMRPPAAEGGPTSEPSPAAEPPPLAPHLSLSAAPAPEETGTATIASATPAPPISSSEEAVPVEIELTPDGQVSFLGEAISESELKSRLQSVAHSNSREPVLIVKDEKVSHSQWQHIVDLCHAVKLKVNLKTVKSSDSTGLKPRIQPAVALVPPPAAGDGSGAKILPVEIDLARQGHMTFEGDSVNLDELKGRLATIAQGNPDQPVVIVKENGVSDDSADALVTVCQGVSPRLKVSVKSAPAFTPSFPDNAPAANLPAPTVHMHASLDALNNSTASSP